jgi:hypothetical protein
MANNTSNRGLGGLINQAHHLGSLLNPTKECDIVWERHFGQLTRVQDCDGRWIERAEYGKLTAFGWEIDHALPSILGGLDIYANKRPRHWRGNRSAGGLINSLLNPTR